MASSPVTAPSPPAPTAASPPTSTLSPPSPPQLEEESPAASPPPPNETPSQASPPPPSPPPPPSKKVSSPDTKSNSPPPPPPPPPPSPPTTSTSKTPPPPPPTRAIKSPPTSSGSPATSKSSLSPPSTNEELSSLNVPLILGTIFGVLLFFVTILAISVCCFKKKKKKKKLLPPAPPHDQMHYYADPTGADYYNKTPYQNWHNVAGAQMNPPGKLPPPPGMGWQPPPAPPMMSSGDMSSNFSSGPRQPLRPPPPPPPNMSLGFNKSQFSYDELSAATEGFSSANMLGQGGFGYVHKGILPDGKEIAVKSLKSGSGQGEREFQAEVEIISRVHHRHLVSLVGYCIAGGQRMLVYEFVPNGTLEYHLHGKGRPTMDWSTRMKIALGSAKGLAYLHEDCHPRIIHRDIKTANILLDNNFEAMVADFGLAKLSSDTNTHVSTRVMGTFGYLAPEYASSGKLTEKSDVFSFGVMLLELVTGKRPVNSSEMEDSLVDWARPLLAAAMEDGNYSDLADPRIEGNYDSAEMARLAGCAAASVRHSARRRPKMSQIVRALEGDLSLDVFKEGVKPGQSGNYSSSDYDSSSYSSDMKKFQKLALGSEEFPSNEYGSESGSSREIK